MNASVLIVDDESNIRLMLRTALSSVGYTVVEAGNGRQALELIESAVPDVMILDLSMPVLDGMAVLQELKRSRAPRKPRVVVLTAHGSIPAAANATRLGAVDFLEKPVVPQEVRDAVESALAEPIPFPKSPADDAMDGGYAGALTRVRKALRLGQFTDAETLLMRAADLAHRDAPYFNLLGVLYEAQKKWPLAKKFYGKAIRIDKRYVPAQTNMRRIYELYTFGRSEKAVTLGDEPNVRFTRTPEATAHGTSGT